jgi:lipopolysaccharide transport system permease protein
MKQQFYDAGTLPLSAAPIKSPALNDLFSGIRNTNVWWSMAKVAIKARFRRTVIGPFWITLSLAIWISMLSLVNSYLFHTSVFENFPRLVVGMIFWTLLTSILNEGCMAIISHEGLIKNLPLSIINYVLNVIAQNSIIFAFNMLLYPLAFLFLMHKTSINIFLVIPGLLIFLVNVAWVTTVLAILSTRFRDLPRIVNSLTQVAFFVTPVFWLPNPDSIPIFINLNPFYHMMEIVRAPLIGQMPNIHSLLITGVAAVAGSIFTIWLYEKTFARVRLWL